MASIITIGNQKGGVGKTTITALFANLLHGNKNLSVAVIDTDPQSSLFNHASSIAEYYPSNVKFKFYNKSINSTVKELQNDEELQQYDLILIDTLPTTDTSIVSLFAISDIILIPVGATTLDITATLETIAVLNALKKPFKIFFNNVKSVKEKEKIKDMLLASHPELSILENFLSNRVSYAKYFANSFILDDKKATKELLNVFNEVLGE